MWLVQGTDAYKHITLSPYPAPSFSSQAPDAVYYVPSFITEEEADILWRKVQDGPMCGGEQRTQPRSCPDVTLL